MLSLQNVPKKYYRKIIVQFCDAVKSLKFELSQNS